MNMLSSRLYVVGPVIWLQSLLLYIICVRQWYRIVLQNFSASASNEMQSMSINSLHLYRIISSTNNCLTTEYNNCMYGLYKVHASWNYRAL